MPTVGVLLAGCGVQDGNEVYETVLSILSIENAGAQWIAFAPDVEQADVVNHYTGEEDRLQSRNVLPEAGRMVRGHIRSLSEVSAHEIDALVIPGGYGVAKNLCSFAADGENAVINPEVARLIQDLHSLGKPIGAICIAPVLVALALRGRGVGLTVGDDAATSAAINRLDAQHHVTSVQEIFIDQQHKVVSTAAFMLAQSASEAEPGISRLVNAVLSLVPQQ